MKSSKTLLLLIFFLLASCSQEKTNIIVIKDVPISDTLFGRLVIDPEKVVFSPWSLTICDDLLVTYTENKEFLFDIWDISNDYRNVGQFGREGSSAADFNQIESNSLVGNDSTISFYCTGNMVYKTVKLDGDFSRVIESVPISSPGFGIDRVRKVTDSLFVASSEVEEFEFAALNPSKSHPVFFGTIQDEWFCSPPDSNQKRWSRASNRCVNAQSGDMVAFYSRFKKVRFYNSSQELLRDIDVQIEPFQKCLSDLDETYGYSFPYSTPQQIFVICHHTTDYRNASYCELQIWNWRGELVARYILDKNISRVLFSKKYNVIIGKSYSDELYEFTLPDK